MSKFNSVVFGKITGSIGNATASIWRGINTIREKPTTVANPRSPGQVTQRVLFTALVAMSRIFNVAFNIGFAKAAIRKTPYNVFMSLNQASGFVTNPAGTPVYDIENIVLSRGSAAAITSINSEIDGNSVLFEVSTLAGPPPPANSVMYAALITQTGAEAPVLRAFDEYSVIFGQSEIVSGTPLAGSAVYLCVFYVNSSTLQPCDSFVVVVP